MTPAGELLDVCVGANYLRESGGFLYACDGMAGDIVALRIEPGSGALSLVNKQSCLDLHDVPCFLDFTKDGRWCLTAAYCDGTVAVWPVSPDDGSLGECTDSKKQSARYNPVLADRQETAHAHQVLLDSTEKWALVCDLGCDCVYVYAFDSERGSLQGSAIDPRHLRLPEGSGPRHLEFHPSGKWVFITCELSGAVVTASFDGATGKLRNTSSINALVRCS